MIRLKFVPDVALVDQQLTAVFTKASGAQKHPLSPVERSSVLENYNLYDELGGKASSHLYPAILNSCRDFIRKSYGQVQKAGKLSSLRDSLFASVKRCPYCGVGTPIDLDHFLPKATFGELAIYPRNLVPCCKDCNFEKGKIQPTAGQCSDILHPYFDILPEARILCADVELECGSLDVSFFVDDTHIGASLASTFRSHILNLNLDKRYRDLASGFLWDLEVSIMRVRSSGKDALVDYLNETAENSSRRHGANSWKTAFLYGLCVCECFCKCPSKFYG